ncbi:hypothetical protein BD310DRAFT_410960 [Dichomitus squalens]|uniref:Uncharacterized protein n=1 Tax=Dichomitus squalens TaxID=114155 RepID=A0A4Q9PXT6_9APHY|nr:hypothetical protein BD310DRAFT_410960 [Dichomitus squalens]
MCVQVCPCPRRIHSAPTPGTNGEWANAPGCLGHGSTSAPAFPGGLEDSYPVGCGNAVADHRKSTWPISQDHPTPGEVLRLLSSINSAMAAVPNLGACRSDTCVTVRVRDRPTTGRTRIVDRSSAEEIPSATGEFGQGDRALTRSPTHASLLIIGHPHLVSREPGTASHQA